MLEAARFRARHKTVFKWIGYKWEILSWDEVEEAEADEMWSFVHSKDNERWLWYAIDHDTREILAYVFGKRTLIANLLKNDLCRARNRAASSMFRAKAEGDF